MMHFVINPCHKYLHFSDSINRINNSYQLFDHKQVKVLEAVLSAHAEGAMLSVLDVLLLKEIASQATLHLILKKLIALKLIKTQSCKKDARRKYIAPSNLGMA